MTLRDLIDARDLSAFKLHVRDADRLQERFDDGYDALLYCVENGRLEMAEHALAHGADANVVTKSSLYSPRSALQMAIQRPRPRMVELLLRHGAVLRAGAAVMKWLEADAPPEVLRALRGEPSGATDDPRVVIHDMLVARFGPELAGCGAPDVVPNEPARDVIEDAVAARDDARLEAELAAAFPEGRMQKKSTPALKAERSTRLWRALGKAVELGSLRAAELLLLYGADPKGGDVTPLHEAVTTRNEPMVTLLLEHGANPNAWTEEWSYPAGPPHASPISLAAQEGLESILRLMLGKVKRVTQAKVRMSDVDPLAVAATPTIVDLLMERGAKVTGEALGNLIGMSHWDGLRRALEQEDLKLGKGEGDEPTLLDQALSAGAPADVVARLLDLGIRPRAAFPKGTPAALLELLAQRKVASPLPTRLEDIAPDASLQEVLELLARSSDAWRWAQQKLAELGRFDLLSDLAMKYVPHDDEAVATLKRVEPELALRLLAAWKIPLESQRATKLLRLVIEAGNPDAAVALLRAGVAVEPAPGFTATVNVAARSGDRGIIEAVLERAVPTFDMAMYWLGYAHKTRLSAADRDAVTRVIVSKIPAGEKDGLLDYALTAAAGGYLADVERAVSIDPDVLRPRADGFHHKSVLRRACVFGAPDVVRSCLDRGADPNERNLAEGSSHPSTLLAASAEHGHAEVARMLLVAGADPRALGTHGETALAWAKTDELWTLLREAAGPALYPES